MNNGDMPASPVGIQFGKGYHTDFDGNGLTKREQFAAMAMQGIMASKYYGEHSADNVKSGVGRENGAAIKAVMMADALLKALEEDAS